MAPKLYYLPGSPVSRGTLLTVKALNLDVEHKLLDVTKGEQMSPEYLKLNPQHTIPTLEDGDFVVWDSHAINPYLVEKYGKDDSLYPKDIEKRAIINQRLHFDSGILFPRLGAIVAPVIFANAKTIPKDKSDAVVAAYAFLEAFLENHSYVAGDTLTIADFSIVASISTLNVFVPFASNRFPRISEWYSKMQSLPYYGEANQVGLDQFAAHFKSKLA